MANLVHRAITEAVESVVSTEARVGILVRALGRAGLASIPERGPEVTRFVETSLAETLRERLGDDAADAIVESLRPVLRFAARPPSIPSIPAVRRPVTQPTVPPVKRTPTRPADAPPAPGVQAPRVQSPRVDASLGGSAEDLELPDLPLPGWAPAVSTVSGPIHSTSASTAPPPGVVSVPVRVIGARSAFGVAPEEDSGVYVTPSTRPPVITSRVATPSGGWARPSFTLPPASSFIVASNDETLARECEEMAGMHIRVVRGLMDLVDATEEAAGSQTLLVFDCMAPPVHLASLLALAADLPASLDVALLGAGEADRAVLATSPERTMRWVQVARPNDAADLVGRMLEAAACARAVGP